MNLKRQSYPVDIKQNPRSMSSQRTQAAFCNTPPETTIVAAIQHSLMHSFTVKPVPLSNLTLHNGDRSSLATGN
jgi:hypothetical protein